MRRDLAALDSNHFDVIVIGAGIFGACAAWDATLRGLKVALIDRGDFSGATSANSFKMIHGGIRYIQHGDLYRIRQSALARRTFIRVAPHLCYPLPIVVPTYGYGMKSKYAIRIAMSVYDMVAWDRNRGILDPIRQIPRGACLSRSAVIDQYPGLDHEDLTGAAVFSDGQMYNPPRLTLAFIRSASEAGAIVANYVEAKSFIRRGDQICGVEARDVLDEDAITIQGRVVLNATGPYAEELLQRGLGRSLSPRTSWSRDSYFVVDRRLVAGSSTLALPAKTNDPDSVLSRGPRHLFLSPWHDQTLVGVWHKVYEGDPDAYGLGDEELELFIGEINSVYRGLNLSLGEVSFWNAGLIPFGENDPSAINLKFAHRSRIVDHQSDQGIDGLITLIGVRYTTGPNEAVKVVDLVFRKLGRKAPASKLYKTPVHGGRIDDFDLLLRRALSEASSLISKEVVRSLVHNHGNEYGRILELVRARPELGQTIGASNVLAAEAVYAATEEMAQKLEDVVLRRTDLGTTRFPGQASIRLCASVLATELGWDQSRANREVEQTVDRFPVSIRGQSDNSLETDEDQRGLVDR